MLSLAAYNTAKFWKIKFHLNQFILCYFQIMILIDKGIRWLETFSTEWKNTQGRNLGISFLDCQSSSTRASWKISAHLIFFPVSIIFKKIEKNLITYPSFTEFYFYLWFIMLSCVSNVRSDVIPKILSEEIASDVISSK